MAVLDLLDEFAPPTWLPGDLSTYAPLVKADPRRLARLLATPDRAGWLTAVWLPRPVLHGLSRLDIADLVPVARHMRDQDRAFATLLRAVAPSRRAELYDATFADVDTAHTVLADAVLDVLPHDRRATEARRILDLASVRQDEHQVLHYTSRLPWAEAAGTLTAATRAITAEDRASAYELLIQCAARSRDTVAVNDAVSRAVRVRNEQDPVRVRVLASLARMSARLLDAGAVADLDRLVIEALDARDASRGTRQAVSTLVVAVLREHAVDPDLVAWATGALRRIFADGRLPWLGDLTRHLRRGQEVDFFEAVRGWVTGSVRRGEHGPLFAVASALGKRGWTLEPLQDMLGNAVNRGNKAHVVRTAIELWLRPRATRGVRVAEVLAFDPSAVAIPEVWTAISAYRTDLLDKVLGERPKGMFLNAGPRWVPPHAVRPDRWLDRQQRRYVELLGRVAADKGAVLRDRARVIAVAARIPRYGWDATARWLDAPETILAEAALGALVWTDRPADALLPLLTHAGDDRARVGSYAAARAARLTPPSRLGPILTGQAMRDGKITTRKQLVRLVATLCIPDTGAALLDEWRRDGQHRDVRAAIVSAARQRTDLPESWTILAEATGRADALALLAANPFEVAEPRRGRYAALVTACGASDDDTTASAAWAAVQTWVPWAPELTGPLTDRLTAVHDRQVWRAAAHTLTMLVGNGGGSTPVCASLARLVDLDRDDPGTDPEHDRPAFRRVEELTGHLVDWSRRASRDASRAALADAADVLAGYDPCAWQAATLRLETVSLVDPDLTALLATLGAGLGARPSLAAGLRAELAERVGRDSRWAPDDLIATAGALAASGGAAGGQFAVALAAGGARSGWSQPWRELVATLRRHRDPEVRDAALRLRLDSA